ncbi:MAG: carboxypeptidase-like regulatory domain-containing protein [Bacteroidales bacterium]|nr:carboxypeptidase-like regulatory domain-containing protein [Candidatus Colimorpha pelethequi]
MSHGKTICQHLKAIRRDIARENGIDLEIPECTFKGECCGTCPQCESELRTLEHELAKRISIGKVATVAGLALGLATPLAAQNVETQKQPTPINATETHKESILKPNKAHEFTISGIVTDSVNKEPLPFANVVLKYNDTIIARSQTDFDGKYILDSIASGYQYQLEASCVGYSKVEETIHNLTQNKHIDISLKAFGMLMGEVIILRNEEPSFQQKIKYDGMEVKVKY